MSEQVGKGDWKWAELNLSEVLKECGTAEIISPHVWPLGK